MEHTIGFPNLGLEFTLSRVACTVLGKDIYWYGIIICAGFILAALYVNSRTKEFGITSDNLMDCLIICVPLGIICARIYYVVFEWSYYAEHPSEIIAIWKGGIAIYGGIIGTLIGLFVYSRVKKLSFASLCDLAAFGRLIGPCIGRCCFEVGPEVPEAMRQALGPDAEAAIEPHGEKSHVDLKLLNRSWLEKAGVRAIDICPDCTKCQPNRFWSHRVTGGNRGSQAAIIRLKGGAPA